MAKKKKGKKAQDTYQEMEDASGSSMRDTEEAIDIVPAGTYLWKMKWCKMVAVKDQTKPKGYRLTWLAEIADDNNGIDQKLVGKTMFGGLTLPDKTRNKPLTHMFLKKFIQALHIDFSALPDDHWEAGPIIAAEATGQTFYASAIVKKDQNEQNRNDFGNMYSDEPPVMGVFAGPE